MRDRARLPAIAAGANVHDVQRWMGHRHLSTTMRYVHHRPQHQAADLLGTRFSGVAGQLDALLGDPAVIEIAPPADATADDFARGKTSG